jgi:protein SCO1/2
MWLCRFILNALPFVIWLAILSSIPSGKSSPPVAGKAAFPLCFAVRGVVLSVNRGQPGIVIRHEAITNYMAAMTMPFQVKNPDELAGFERGDIITFQLHVAGAGSWVDHLTKTGTASLPPIETLAIAPPAASLRNYHFTNELGQPVSLDDFRGQALAVTFIYTRCPLPDFCPRLSKNFQEASQKLLAQSAAPTNWHFLSISFDPEFDAPATLAAYARTYHYDPKHWSLLTGPKEKIRELARQSDVSYQADGGTFNHNLRTLIVDAKGQLQMVFPTSGDLSDAIASEIIKAAGPTNHPVSITHTQKAK